MRRRGYAAYRDELIAARRKIGLSTADMALRLLTPRATYEQWESGAHRTPGVATIAARYVVNSYREPATAAAAAATAAREETAALYHRGWSYAEIMGHLGIGHSTVTDRLRAAGVSPRAGRRNRRTPK